MDQRTGKATILAKKEMRTPTILETDDQGHLEDQEGREIQGDHLEDPEI